MLRLMVMGSPVLIRDGVALDGASNAQRRIAFMSMLACAGADRGVARDRLLLLFWPEKTEAQGRNALKQLTFALRRDLAAPDLLLGTSELRLNAAVITSDVGDFLSAAQSGDWETATSAYRGPLLDGIHLSDAPEFHDWLDEQRRRVDRLYRSALMAQLDQAHAEGDAFERIRILRLLSEQDPLASDTAVQLVEELASVGRVTDALRCAQEYSHRVQRELGVAPDSEFLAVVDRIRAEVRPARADGLLALPKASRRWRRVIAGGVIAASIPAIAVIGFLSRRPSVTRTLWAERVAATRAPDRGARGRIFIETPINQTGQIALDSIGEQIGVFLRKFVSSSRNAVLVPRDTVEAIERSSTRLALNTPAQRLPRANAAINVMTLYSLSQDSLRIAIYLQRLVTGPHTSVSFTNFGFERTERIDSLPVLETWPLGTSVAPLDRPYDAIFLTGRRLNINLLAMRSCDADIPGRRELVPWCWVADNRSDVVSGYFKQIGYKP